MTQALSGDCLKPQSDSPGTDIRSRKLREHDSAHRAPLSFIAMRALLKQIRTGLAATLLGAVPAAALAGNTWDFRVFLDDKEIGTHRFELLDKGGGERQLTSQARMAVKLLFVTAYTYDHHDVEHWNGDCLTKLSSKTDDNGDEYKVDVQRQGAATLVQTRDGAQTLGDCVLTFAYWNPAMLKQTRLLNSQDGEHIEVKIVDAGADSIVVRGVKTTARRYELRSKNQKLSIDLWYSPGDEWLALESRTERGQKLIYKLK
jgi:hypothetical protein